MPLNRVHNSLKIGAAILAVFPGLAVYIRLADVPPDFVGTAQIISFSLSILAVLCIILYSKRIGRLPLKWVVACAFLLLFLGMGCLLVYTDFARSKVLVDYWTEAPAATEKDLPRRIIPLTPPQDIGEMLGRFEGRNEKEKYEAALEGLSTEDAEHLRTRMNEENWSSYAIMALLLVLSQILLVAPPVAVATRVVASEPDAPVDR